MSNVTDFYEYATCSIIDDVKKAELDSIDFNAIVYETSGYTVSPTISLALSGEPLVKYGIYNKETNVMEAEASQMVTAIGWAKALTEANTAKGGESDVFGPPAFTLGEDDDDGPKVH